MTLSNGQTVTLQPDDWSATVSNLPKYANGQVISYSWTEDTVPEGYTLTGTVVEGDLTTFTNTLKTGDLTVSKTVASGDASTTFNVKVTLTKSGASLTGTFGDVTFNNGVGTFTITDGQTKTISGLPEGTAYEVEETDLTHGWTATYSGESGSIVAGQTKAATMFIKGH